MSATYSLQDNAPAPVHNHRKHRRGSRHKQHDPNQQQGGQDADPNDGTGSLTYSATSSVNSNSSATGESTDSSFADIMRVLDLDDSSELAALMQKEGITDPDHISLMSKRGERRAAAAAAASPGRAIGGGVSVTSSLNYSEDGESSMSGDPMGVVGAGEATSGQTSDSGANDGGGLGANDSIFFAPAEAADGPKSKNSRSSKTKSSSTKHRHSGGSNSNGKDKKSAKGKVKKDRPSPPKSTPPKSKSRSISSKTPSAPTPPPGAVALDDRSSAGSASTPTSPPPRARKAAHEVNTNASGGGKVWYSQWWMCGFSDALNFSTK